MCSLITPDDNVVWLFQKDDLTAVVDYLRTDGNVSCIGLWGRSMGAVTRYSFWALGHYIEFIVFGYWAQHTVNMEDLINCIFIFQERILQLLTYHIFFFFVVNI